MGPDSQATGGDVQAAGGEDALLVGDEAPGRRRTPTRNQIHVDDMPASGSN